MQTTFVILMIVLICISANNFVYVFKNKGHKYRMDMLILNAIGIVGCLAALIIGTIIKD